jgi:hypothetical protein
MAIDDMEHRCLEGRLIQGIVAILHPREPLQPTLGSITDEATKIHHNYPICHLRLSIGLRLESRAHAKLSTEEMKEFLPH